MFIYYEICSEFDYKNVTCISFEALCPAPLSRIMEKKTSVSGSTVRVKVRFTIRAIRHMT